MALVDFLSFLVIEDSLYLIRLYLEEWCIVEDVGSSVLWCNSILSVGANRNCNLK